MSLKFEYANDLADIDRFKEAESPEPPFAPPFPSDEFLREYDAAYDVIFACLAPLGCYESGGRHRGAFAMCRYVDPTRSISVVVRDPSADLQAAVTAVHLALQSIPEHYSVCFESYPTTVCVARSGRALGYDRESKAEHLIPYGFLRSNS
jgi:hypothetical protein